jgi:lysophospholipase L1-like esterase
MGPDHMIVCIGDSITYGQHLTDRTKPWPRLLKDDVISVGVPGDTTRLGLERFPKDVQAYEPDTVIIQFGHNDCNRWDTDRGLPRVSDRAFMANLEEMIDRCRVFGAKPHLCTMTPSLRSDQHHEDVERYNEIIRQVAETSMVPLIEVWATFLAYGAYADLLMKDGLHLTELGHVIYAQVVQAVLDA